MTKDVAPAKTSGPSFPRRDANGRIASLGEMLGGVLGNLVLGAIVLAIIDGIVTLAGAGTFGRISGWLAGILMVLMFVDEFRAWRIGSVRIAVAFVGGGFGVLAGVLASIRVGLPNHLFTGLVGVTIAGAIYALIWFYGIRELADRLGEK